jgi:hypothetical protein
MAAGFMVDEVTEQKGAISPATRIFRPRYPDAMRHGTRLPNVAVAVAVAVAACSRKPPPAPAPAPPPTPSALSPSDSALRSRISTFFAGYHDGSDFDFLRTSCVSPVDTFVTAHHADVGTLIASALLFFRDKPGLHYEPDLASVRIDHQGDVTVAQLPVTMSWGVRRPSLWTPSYDRAPPDSGAPFDPLLWNMVLRTTTVPVTLTFTADLRLTSYVEGPIERPTLRATGQEYCSDADDEPGIPIVALAKGTTVTDLGETYEPSMSAKGPQIIRHVELRGGGDVWTYDTRSYSVPVDPSQGGGTAAGRSDCLETLPTAAAP